MSAARNSRRRWRGKYLGAGILLYRGHGPSLEVYLGRRDAPPYPGHWTVPGGGIETDDATGILETPLVAALRELGEETNVSVIVAAGEEPPYVQLHVPFVFSSWTFLLPVRSTAAVRPIDEFDEADWFPVNRLPKPLHIGVGRAVRRLRRIDRKR